MLRSVQGIEENVTLHRIADLLSYRPQGLQAPDYTLESNAVVERMWHI